MFSQTSNNKPSGATAIQCDSGIPVVGRTSDTGVYQILKVNADGSLPFTPMVPEADSSVPYSLTPTSYNTGIVGLKAVGILMGYIDVNTTAIVEGVYTLEPWFVTEQTAGGAVSMMLIKAGSTLDTYASTRIVGSDSFNPTITDMISGGACFWHSVLMNTVSTAGVCIAYNNSNGNDVMIEQCFLEAGLYKLAIFVHTAITTTSATTFAGMKQFTKIS